jgi:hypothetical protein
MQEGSVPFRALSSEMQARGRRMPMFVSFRYKRNPQVDDGSTKLNFPFFTTSPLSNLFLAVPMHRYPHTLKYTMHSPPSHP